MYYKLGRAGRALDRFGVIEFATTIAPGVRDVLLTGKVYEATKRNARNKGAIEYDAVVLDAPPTGRITQFLGVTNELAGLAKVGPIKTPVRQRDAAATLRPHRRAPGHRAGGDARPGDRRRHRRPADPRPPGRRRGGQPGAPPRPRRQGPGGRAQGEGRHGRRDGRPEEGGAGRRRRRWSSGLLAEARDHAERRALEDEQREVVAGLGRADVRAAPADGRHRPRRALRAGRAAPRPGDGLDDAHQRQGRAAVDQGGAPPRRRRPPRRRVGRHHRVLRLGRRRQDDHLGRPGAAGRRARASRRGAHDRPGPPAGAVDGHRRARQHAPAGGGHRHRAQGAASTR